MKKVIQYLKDNGLFETIKRIFKRLLSFIGLIKSESYVLRFKLNNDNEEKEFNLPNYRIEKLQDGHLDQFNKIKYYDFLDGEKLLNSKNSSVLIALDGDNIIGFVCCHRNIKHTIHGLGHWFLGEKEMWVGPTYVTKSYRNKKVHKLLLIRTVEFMYKSGIREFYTAINKNNVPSIKSFRNIGFKEIGMIKIRKLLNLIIRINLIEYDDRNIVSSKYFAKK